MSVIPLAEMKSAYYYEDIIGKEFSIPIKKGRTYTSPKEMNGYRDQTFSSDTMPKEIVAKCVGVTKYSPDGIVHPVVVGQENLIEEFRMQGFIGYQNGPDELNLLCKIFGANDGMKEIRSINQSDLKNISVSGKSEFWVASRNANLNFDYMYFFVHCFNGHFFDTDMYISNRKDSVHCYGVRPVFILDTEIKFPEPEIIWV